MPDTVRERHFRDRMHSVRQLLNLPEAEQRLMSGQDYEDLVALCLELSVSGRELIDHEFRRVFKDQNVTVAWLKERRRVIEELSDAYLHLADSVRSSVFEAHQHTGNSPAQDVVALLDSAVKAIEEARSRALEHWLIGDAQQIADAKAAIARGETVDVDDAFADIAGTDVDNWRRDVQEYKRRRQASAGK